MEYFRKYLHQYLVLSDHEWNVFSKLYSVGTLKKGEFFARQGRVETSSGYLKKGVVRAFYRSSEGQEYNNMFFIDNQYFGAYASMVTRQPNKIDIQALTDCEILIADYSSITLLFDEFPRLERLGRLIAEKFFVYKEKRENELLMLQANERYEVFKQTYPNLENLIPQYHIASYLGITPTQLSRIRKQR